MKIYIKPYCPYCIRLLHLLDEAGISYDIRDVLADPSAGRTMSERSGQSGVPQVEIDDSIIPDYISEETLVTDIRQLLSHGTQDPETVARLTSTFVRWRT